MARSCTVCISSDLVAIDKALVAGLSQAAISAKFKVGEAAIQRHRKSHLSPALVAVKTRRDSLRATGNVNRLEGGVDLVEEQLYAAAEAGDSSLVLKTFREYRSGLELLARLTGELDERPTTTTTINVLASPEVAQLATALMIALAPYPQARIAAAAVLDVEEVAS